METLKKVSKAIKKIALRLMQELMQRRLITTVEFLSGRQMPVHIRILIQGVMVLLGLILLLVQVLALMLGQEQMLVEGLGLMVGVGFTLILWLGLQSAILLMIWLGLMLVIGLGQLLGLLLRLGFRVESVLGQFLGVVLALVLELLVFPGLLIIRKLPDTNQNLGILGLILIQHLVFGLLLGLTLGAGFILVSVLLQTMNKKNKQTYLLKDKLSEKLPEEYRADLEALRKRYFEGGIPEPLINIMTGFHLLTMFRAYLQIKIENIWLSKRNQG